MANAALANSKRMEKNLALHIKHFAEFAKSNCLRMAGNWVKNGRAGIDCGLASSRDTLAV